MTHPPKGFPAARRTASARADRQYTRRLLNVANVTSLVRILHHHHGRGKAVRTQLNLEDVQSAAHARFEQQVEHFVALLLWIVCEQPCAVAAIQPTDPLEAQTKSTPSMTTNTIRRPAAAFLMPLLNSAKPFLGRRYFYRLA